MMLIPAVEAAEQTVIQKVVPFRTQGRVFGFAPAFESAAAPDHGVPHRPDRASSSIIPYMESDAGQQAWGWLLGEGRRAASPSCSSFAGLVMVVIARLRS